MAGCYYSPNFSKNREEVTVETINGEIVVDWYNFTTKENTIGEKTKIIIITDGDVGDESSIAVFGLVEAVILGMTNVDGMLFQRARFHLTGGVRLDVINTADRENPNRFPCTLTYE